MGVGASSGCDFGEDIGSPQRGLGAPESVCQSGSFSTWMASFSASIASVLGLVWAVSAFLPLIP